MNTFIIILISILKDIMIWWENKNKYNWSKISKVSWLPRDFFYGVESRAWSEKYAFSHQSLGYNTMCPTLIFMQISTGEF